MENEEKVDETTTSSDEEEAVVEEDESEDSTDASELEALQAEVERERTARQQLTARAKKAEDELRALKEASKVSKSESPQPASPDVDERVLKAQGMPDDLLKELKVVAQARGVSLIDAVNDPVFAVIKGDYEKKQRADDASLGASKGAVKTKPKKDFRTPNLSRDEHKEMFKQFIN